MSIATETIPEFRTEKGIHYLKNYSAIVYLLTFLFLYASISAELFKNAGIYYFLMLIMLLAIISFYESEPREDGSYKELLPREHFKLESIPHQVVGGMVCLLIYLIPISLLGQIQPVSSVTPENFASTLILMVVVVGMVEAILLIVYVRIVWMGIFIFPFLFAFTHPMIAQNWTQGIVTQDSVTFFIYAVSMAFIFIGIFLLRDVDWKHRKYFGAVTQAVFHGGINTVAVLSFISIGGVPLG